MLYREAEIGQRLMCGVQTIGILADLFIPDETISWRVI